MKKLKRLWKFTLVFVLSVAMLLGNFSLMAFADVSPKSPITGPEMFSGSVETEVELDDSFEIPTAKDDGTVITVTDPKGDDVTPEGGTTVAANRRGIYVVKATNGDYTYQYNVYCKESGEYTLKVNNDQDIPSFATKGTTIEKLPDATFTDEEDNEVEDAEIVIQVLDNASGTVTKKPGESYTFNNEGSVFFTYKIKGTTENLYKSYSKVYEVKVQDSFRDETNPTITVSGVPNSAQIRNKVTLPVATAKDDIDERVKVYVEVTAPTEGGVIHAAKDIDEDTGYALTFEEEKVVTFDNDKNMYFYPEKEGIYTILYYAEDDNGNQSAKHKYYLTVSTSNAPVLVDESDLDDAIPSQWGRKIGNKNSSQVEPVITFPMPEFRHQDPETKISVEFTIKSDDVNRMVYFKDIYAIRNEEDTTEVTATEVNKYNGDEEQGVVFTEDGFEFDVRKIAVSDFKAGTYTATYRAMAANRTRTKTIKFDLSTSYNDEDLPTVEDIKGTEDLYLGKDTTYTVPEVTYSDRMDKNPKLEYTLNVGETAVNVEGGEVYDIVKKDEGGYKFVDEDDNDVIDLNGTDNIVLKYKVTDSVGNATEEKEFTVNVHDTSSVVSELNLTYDKINTETVDRTQSDLENPNEIDFGGFEFEVGEDNLLYGYEISINNPDGNALIFKASRVVTDSKIYVRNITFTADEEGIYTMFVRIFDINGKSRLYGFNKEITGYAKNGSNYTRIASAVDFNTGSNNINGDYNLPDSKNLSEDLYRVITIEGRKYSVLGNTFRPLEVGTYKIYSNTIAKDTFDGDKTFNVEDLDGGKLSLYKHGSSTDSAAPEFDIDDHEPYIVKAVADDNFDEDAATFTYDQDGKIKWSITAEDGTKNEYTGNGAWYVLPRVTAYTVNDVAERIDIKISYSGSGSMSSTSKIDGEENGEIGRVYYNTAEDYYTLNKYEATENNELKEGYVFANRWAFFAGNDSTYTITYTAYAANSGLTATETQKIIVGDIISPTINIALANESGKGFVVKDKDGKHITSAYKSGNVFFFDFNKANVSIDSKDTESNVEVKFVLSDSNGVVYQSSDFTTEWITLENLSNRLGSEKQKDGYVLETGRYTVSIVVRDENGNESAPKTFEFTVSADSNTMSTPLKVLTWVLSILAGLLIIFVIVYIVRLRRIKK